ncbi:PREDICTED: coiled-coil domain-containing protein 25-like [Acropora digitifera]|uniref:coiled-coil domain-containing protein 25-like n=1 Tax=Acropora digitifera TaxID=70779 RepID=UPI00077A02BD|nr:PREDICTED: coiled-coil domain-containing protein 25-like [Acropora digitifera]
MVLYFRSDVVTPPYTIFMGADKHENEDLIKWGFPEDVWFHVDKMSSAHVYIRLRKVFGVGIQESRVAFENSSERERKQGEE